MVPWDWTLPRLEGSDELSDVEDVELAGGGVSNLKNPIHTMGFLETPPKRMVEIMENPLKKNGMIWGVTIIFRNTQTWERAKELLSPQVSFFSAHLMAGPNSRFLGGERSPPNKR